MAFKVKRAKALQVETDRVESIILMPKFWRKEWTQESLQEALAEIGLVYEDAEIEAINGELHRRGVVEDLGPSPA